MAVWLLASLAIVLAALLVWRQLDVYLDRAAWTRLADRSRQDDVRFDTSMIADLPGPARRYFEFMIETGTPIRTAVCIEMTGELGLGTKSEPRYQPMTATQILAPPHGLVWKVKSGILSGSDGALPEASWTRFWLLGLLPVVRVSNADHQRSAFGRVVAEAAFWAPASLLPSDTVAWEGVASDTARATVRNGKFTQSVDVTVDALGAPTEVLIQRWSNENPEKEFREQPFGGYPSDYQRVDGYRLPMHVKGGNHFGTADYFPFFKADVTKIDLI